MDLSTRAPRALEPKAGAQDLESLVLSCNKDGMDNLRSGDLKLAVEQLKYAEAILIASQRQSSQNDPLLAVTFNNLGCLYKRSGRTHAALSYLRRALRIEVGQKADNLTVAGTHLNICSILSKLGKHDKAAQHALCALELLTLKFAALGPESSSDDYSVLAIAYHNVAVEREFLEQWDQAATAYKQGHQVALRSLGPEHALTKALLAACDSVIVKKREARPGSQKRLLSQKPGSAGGIGMPGMGYSSGDDTDPETTSPPQQRPQTAQGLSGGAGVKLPPISDSPGRPQSATMPMSPPGHMYPPLRPPGTGSVVVPNTPASVSMRNPEVYVEMMHAIPQPGPGTGSMKKMDLVDEETRWNEFASSILYQDGEGLTGLMARNTPTPSTLPSGYQTRDATPTPEPFQRPKAPPGPSPGKTSRPGSSMDQMLTQRPGSVASVASTEAPPDTRAGTALDRRTPDPIIEGTAPAEEQDQDQEEGRRRASADISFVKQAPVPGVGNESIAFFSKSADAEANRGDPLALQPPSAMEVLRMFEQVGGSGGRYSKMRGPESGALEQWTSIAEMGDDKTPRRSQGRMNVEPEAIMEQIDLERDKNRNRASIKPSKNDYRPNRLLQGSTRTSLVIRRMSVFNNETFHRDELLAKDQKKARASEARAMSKTAQKLAAERIQRSFRMWRAYLIENREWITTSRICATLIQTTWRAYHIRRVKLDKAANKIQPAVRGFLVRNVCRRHAASVHIQKHIVGVLCRVRIRKYHAAANEIQRVARGKIGRSRVDAFRRLLTRTAIIFQRFVRMMIAKRRVNEAQEKRELEQQLTKGAVDLQRYFRGAKGRQVAEGKTAQMKIKKWKDRAATLIESLLRQRLAKKRVADIRQYQLMAMNTAATTIRKIYLGFMKRRHYLALRTRFTENVEAIRVMQRYVRGFLVRVRMWREAIQAEEQLWASVEMQRLWRGYVGRLRFESKYEEFWRRQVASALIQRYVRGWLARVKVTRVKRALARKEFAVARRRFLAAQKIQALIRGKLVRIVMTMYRNRVVQAATKIQSLHRGYSLRLKLWSQLLHVKAVLLQAHARAFLVRRRRLRLICCVLAIEQKYCFWRTRHPTVRKRLTAMRDTRKNSAKVIQKHYQDHAQAVTVTASGEYGKDKRQSEKSYTLGKALRSREEVVEKIQKDKDAVAEVEDSEEASEDVILARDCLGEVFRLVSLA